MPVQIKDLDDRVTTMAGRMDIQTAERLALTRRVQTLEYLSDEQRPDVELAAHVMRRGMWGRFAWLMTGR